MIFRFVKVVPPGIEPGTQGFSVLDCANFWEEKTQFKVLKVGFWMFNVNGRVEYAMKDEQKKGER